MPVRRLLLSAGFFGAALLVAGAGSVQAQFPPGHNSPGKHTSIPGTLTPDQIRRTLEPFSFPPGFPPEMADAIRSKLQQDQGIDPKLADSTLQKLLSNPAFRKQLEDVARKQKGTGKAPSFEELDRLRKSLPDFLKTPPGGPPVVGERPQLPPLGPDELPTPGGPKTEPMPPPNPLRPPPVPPPPMRPGDLPPGPVDLLRPEGPDLPPIPPPPVGPIPFDPNETPRDRAMRTFASAWERNIGPLDETPALKQALFELAAGTEDFKGADGKNIWEELAKETGDSSSFGDLIDHAALGDSWSMPKFDLPSFSWSRSDTDIGRNTESSGSSSGESWWSRRSSSPRPGGSSSGGSGFGLPGMEGSWLPVVLLAVLLVGALVVWRFWYLKDPHTASSFDPSGPGRWPVDPHRIATRQDVVLAFEYLSVLICGPGAKTWTHTTIAAALAQLATTHGDAAVMLARLYELARYTPADEPLTTAELAEARRLVCGLAGLEDE